jgi:glucose/mannose-6-phosphate isomerase
LLDLAVDRSGMLGWLGDYPRQLRALYPAGRRAGQDAAHGAGQDAARRAGQSVARGAGVFSDVLVLGTGGGSAAAAHVAGSLVRPVLRVPFVVCQGYDPPGYASGGGDGEEGAAPPRGRGLILAISHSGETEETLAAVERLAGCGDAGPTVSSAVVVISGGGRLTAQARRAGWPLVELPKGMQARAVFPGILAAILGVLDGAALTPRGFEAEIEEAATLAEGLAGSWGPAGGAAAGSWGPAGGAAGSWGPAGGADGTDAGEPLTPLTLAGRVADRLLIVYGGAGATEGVARRWKNQMAENGKTLAHWYTVPEAHHDEVVGWDAPAAIREHLFACVLRDLAAEDPRMRKRLEVTSRLLAERVVGSERVVEVSALGRGRLARTVSLCLFGDYLSCYVALLRGLDPTPVPIIISLKEEMARG